MASVFYITLGCAKNEVDTNRMKTLCLRAGFTVAEDPSEADAVIVNTCSFLASATEESIETTLQLAEQAAPGARTVPIIMCGCVPSRYGSELSGELPEVAAFVRADEEDGIVEVLCQVLDIDPATLPASLGAREELVGGILRTVEGSSAFVKISEGCDRMCTFCAIPYIRGHYHSRPLQDILAEVKDLLAQGVREIILIGQDTGIWGSDFDEPSTLAALLKEVGPLVAEVGGWTRVLYLQPEGMTDELIAALRDTPGILPYIDIPIQHANARILKLMNRSGSSAELHQLFAHLRKEIPGMVLRSTGMCGFPTETDEEFEELYDFIQQEEFDYTSVFAYSQEDGTAAARLEGQIPEDIKLERTQRLIDLVEELGFAATARHVGETVDVIIDGVDTTDDGSLELIGHAWFQAPDCDGAVHIAEGSAAVGDMVRVKLVDSFCYELVGEMVGNE